MENKEIKETKPEEAPESTSFDEAPASVNTKLKSPNGFVYQWTMRDEKNSTLLFKIKAMEEKWLQLGYTPVETPQYGSKYPKKEIEYVPNRACPICQNKLIYSTTQAGKKFIKCSTNKYDFQAKKATGCSYIDWMDNQ